MGAWDALGRPARSLAAKCQTNTLRWATVSEVGHSSGRRNGAPAECSVRKMAVLTVNAAVLAGRSLAAYYGVLGDRRGLAPYCGVLPVRSIAGYYRSPWSGEASRPLVSCFSGRARAVLTVSAVCGRRNEAKALRRRLRIAAAEWSGCKAGESVIVRGSNSADTWREARAQVSAL
jgi:hypothetical protein